MSTKISDLTSATSLTGAEEVPLVQTGTTKKTTVGDIQKNANYSTTEQVIGTWIDGKPLYRKMLEDTIPATSTDNTASTKSISISSLNAETIIVNFAFSYNSQYNSYAPMPCFVGQNLATRITVDGSNVTIRNYSTVFNGLPIKICISYTKSTDSAS